MTDGVKNFLTRLGLDAYHDIFVAKGFTLEDDIPYLDGTDLDSMYIFDKLHREQLLLAAPQFKLSREFTLYQWLRSKGLDHYYIGFVQSELTDLIEISRVNLPDEDLYDELEITLPAHKRRLERAVQQLRKKHRPSLPSIPERLDVDPAIKSISPSVNMTSPPAIKTEIPVTYGRWGKPMCLVDAKYDFLLLDATLVSTSDPRDRVDIEFMVDSGSDVVTIRQEVLDTMDLELIGPIRSKGVHAARTKNLYRANLMIGREMLEIEVMGESYDSLGSRVIRHFRHYISGHQHIWLRGDYVDTTMIASVKKQDEHMGIQTIAGVDDEHIEVDTGAGEGIIGEKDEELQHKPGEMSPEEVAETVPDDERVKVAEQDDSESKMQTDFVKVKTNPVSVDLKAGLVSSEKMEFMFSTSHEVSGKENDDLQDHKENIVDETDKLQFADGEVIDVRPIIAANRKRRVNDTSGFQPISGREKVRKSNKQIIHHEGNALQMIGCNGVDDALEQGEEEEEEETVIKQRSIYYRSQVRRKPQNS